MGLFDNPGFFTKSFHSFDKEPNRQRAQGVERIEHGAIQHGRKAAKAGRQIGGRVASSAINIGVHPSCAAAWRGGR